MAFRTGGLYFFKGPSGSHWNSQQFYTCHSVDGDRAMLSSKKGAVWINTEFMKSFFLSVDEGEHTAPSDPIAEFFCE